MANHQMRSAVSPPVDEAMNRFCACLFEYDVASQDWLIDLVQPHAVRRVLPAQSSLFAAGDDVSGYFVVLSGELLVHRRHSPKHKPTIRFLTRGDIFICDAGDCHSADCDAVTGSVVLRIERQLVGALARCNSDLAALLQDVHASELEMLLSSLGAKSLDAKGSLPETTTTGHASDIQPEFGNRVPAPWAVAGPQTPQASVA